MALSASHPYGRAGGTAVQPIYQSLNGFTQQQQQWHSRAVRLPLIHAMAADELPPGLLHALDDWQSAGSSTCRHVYVQAVLLFPTAGCRGINVFPISGYPDIPGAEVVVGISFDPQTNVTLRPSGAGAIAPIFDQNQNPLYALDKLDIYVNISSVSGKPLLNPHKVRKHNKACI